MYKKFYGFEKMPFEDTLDISFFYPAERHKEALAALRYSIQTRKDFVLITGEVGSGKTTLCRILLHEHCGKVNVSYVTNTMVTDGQLLYAIAREFGLRGRKKSKMELLYDLKDFLKASLDKWWCNIIVIDEAQNLSMKTLEEIRMLGNLEANDEKLARIILVGQPELRDKICDPKLRQLRQRISVSSHLDPLSREDVESYIDFRIKRAAGNGKLKFTKEAFDKIFEISNGIPRLVNLCCDQALLLGYLRDKETIDPEIVGAMQESTKERGGVELTTSPDDADESSKPK